MKVVFTSLLMALVPLVSMAQTVFSDSVTAILEPVQKVEIRTAVNGRIEALPVAEGATVSKGDVLVVMDSNVQRARVDFAKISAESDGAILRAQTVLAQAEALRDRVQTARSKGAAQAWEVTQTEQAVELAQADLILAKEARDQAVAQLDLEQATLDEFSIRAPFSATVLQKAAETGETIDTQAVIMEIGNLDRLKATAFVPVAWVDGFSPDRAVSAVLDDAGATEVSLEFILADQRIDPASRTVRVVFELDNSDRSVLAGTSVVISRP